MDKESAEKKYYESKDLWKKNILNYFKLKSEVCLTS